MIGCKKVPKVRSWHLKYQTCILLATKVRYLLYKYELYKNSPHGKAVEFAMQTAYLPPAQYYHSVGLSKLGYAT